MAKKATPPIGTKVWLIKTTRGFIDTCRYKTLTALAPYRNYYWTTKTGAENAFDTIEDRFPKLGPDYELWEGIITSYPNSGWTFAAPVVQLATKKV